MTSAYHRPKVMDQWQYRSTTLIATLDLHTHHFLILGVDSEFLSISYKVYARETVSESSERLAIFFMFPREQFLTSRLP